jgi:LCP family protein required for cell wall assembly
VDQGVSAPSEEEEHELENEVIELQDAALSIVRTERARAPSFENTENYLLVGMDRAWAGQWGRADTLVVAVFDDATGHVGLVSIPRDLHVEVPGHGPARINATLRIATRLDQDPMELVERVVSDTLAMPIHHVVVADIEAFERTVDDVSGVMVDVPCSIIDNFIDRREASGRRILDIEAGRRHMDGRTSAMYVRSRHGRSDWDRARRQQAVLIGLRARIREMSPTEWIPVLAGALDRGVTTTMSRLEMIALVHRLARLSPERMHGMLLGRREVSGHRTSDGRSVLLPNFDAIDHALRHLFEAPSPGVRPEHSECPPADVALR